MKQRIFAILLSLTMMFTLVPTAWAEEVEGKSDSPEIEDSVPTPQEGNTDDPVSQENGELDLKDGSIVISATGYSRGDAEIAYKGDYTISQTGSSIATTNTITVTGGVHNITLKGVNIDVSGKHDGKNT